MKPPRKQKAPFLWPVPQRVTFLGGFCRVLKQEAHASTMVDSDRFELWKKAASIYRGDVKCQDAFFKPDRDRFWSQNCTVKSIRPEGYWLSILPNGIRQASSDARGMFNASKTFGQLLDQFPNELPCMVIEDWPDMPVRGFMLDISRCKVPSTEACSDLVFLLRQLSMNHFELYTEHTFAFKDHRQVWREASPFNSKDISNLLNDCTMRGVELTPNFNSFGHFERWLKHPKYKRLAECPDGFEHPIKGRMPHGTTLRPNETSLRFLDKLWAEFLPLFKDEIFRLWESKRFNLGGDEPWELGLGWSKPLVKKHGKHRVYLDFLKKLHRQAAKHGKEMLFWGDILLESPELVKEIPKDATALLWGYEANHPFAEQCAKMAKAKQKFWFCPGTSAWNTFTGRTENMLTNIESAVTHGRANGAEGLLLTSWGDGGNHQPWPVMIPGLVYAAGLAWNPKGTKREHLARAVNLILNQGAKAKIGELLLELGRAENGLTPPLHNRSLHHALFFATRTELAELLKRHPRKDWARVAKNLQRTRKKMAALPFAAGQTEAIKDELLLGADMAAWAIKRAIVSIDGENTKQLCLELKSLIARFKKIWLYRARPGGLAEAVARMKAVAKEL